MSPRSAAEVLAELERRGIRLGLDPFRSLLAALGRPERAVPVVLVAGTNGKGSTAALLESVALAAGLRVGLYTSPHLERVEERIRADGVSIDSPELSEQLDRVLAAATLAGGEPTYFEALTAAAFLAFADRGLELALLEVGLGGRLDATNAAEPILSVITPIALDHVETLGPTLAAIAREKAGILRAGRPAVLASQPPEAEATLLEAARASGASPSFVGDGVRVLDAAWRGLDGHDLRLDVEGRPLETRLALAGEHQIDNAATAVAAAIALRRLGFAALDERALGSGLARVHWPGRLESAPLSGGRTLLLDAAHNPHGCAALERFLARLGRPFTLLFGALADKDVGAMLPPLAERAAKVVLARPDSPRALEPWTLAARVPPDRLVAVESVPERALARAVEAARGEEMIVACGSIFLVGAVRRAARDGWGAPLP